MHKITRTTITIDENLLTQAKLHAIKNKTSVSKLIQNSLQQHIRTSDKQSPNPSVLQLAGRLNLKGKTPPTRKQIYDQHLQNKMGS